MLSFLKLTFIIALWLVVFSVIWAFVCFRIRPRMDISRSSMLLPSLVLCPLVIYLAMLAFDSNLIFPPIMLASTGDLLAFSIVPALVLGCASGLFAQISSLTRSQIDFWHDKPFVQFALATGRNADSEIRKLVVATVLGDAFLRCLPLLFGELFLIEIFFNAPGIGHDLWHAARTRDYRSVGEYFTLLFFLYGCAYLGLIRIKAMIGARLESYA